ncbi:MAG TPA: hypothetical protein DDW52_15590, partial [Planctomycetaceae bacterium]|nr:hypothetical protein [Planctomycetaceae bacterium]
SKALTAAVAAVLLVSAGVLYAVLKINYHDAARHESFVSAQAGFRAVLAAADKFANVPGSEAARRTALLNALSYFEDFSRQANNDPSLKRDQAQAHARIGAIHEELGNLPEAIEHFETAENYYLEIQSADQGSLPSDSDSLASARSENLNHLGMAYANGGRTAAAIDTLRKATRLQEQIVTPAGRGALGLTNSNLGLVYAKVGQRDRARKTYQRAIEVLEDVADDASDDAATLRSLAAAYQNYAVLLRRDALGSSISEDSSGATLQAAARLLEQALELQQTLAKQPGNRSRMDPDLVSTYLHLGEVRLAQNQLSAARESFRAAEFLCEKLSSISPAPRYRRDLAISQTNLAMTLFDQGESQEALKRLKAAQENYSQLIGRMPENAELLTSLGISLNNQATVLQDLNQAEKALTVYNEAARNLVKARSITPTEQQRNALVRVYKNHAQLLTMADREVEANRLNQKRVALGDPLPGHSFERATP